MKICFLTHNLQQDNGGGVFARHVVEGIRDAMPCEVIVCTSVASGMEYETAIIENGWRRLPAILIHLRRKIRVCDMVHAFDVWPYGVFAAIASFGLKKKLIITAVGSGSILPLYHWFLRPLAHWAYRRAHAVIAISNYTAREVCKRVRAIQIAVIHPGIDLEFLRDAERRPPPQWIVNYRPYILSVGTIRWRKGYKQSIRAFADIAKKFPDLRYVIVGKRHSSAFDRELDGLIRELSLETKVIILDSVENREILYQLYRGAELFILFSQNVNHDVEGFGIVFLEAAALGLPVVGSGDCGADDAVRDGENGILVHSRNPEEFARAASSILYDKSLRERMAAASRLFADDFGWGDKIKEYIGLYRNLI